jgi:hypothetical protein
MFSLPFALFLAVGAIALFSFISVATWSDNRRREREAYYKNETLRKLAEMPSSDALTILREEEAIDFRKRQEGQRLGGLITAAVGIGVMAFLRTIGPDRPVYMIGVIPLLVGFALLCYSYMLAPKQ